VLAVLGPDGGNCGVCHASKASTTNGGFMFNSTDKAGTLAAFVGKMSPGTSGSKCGGKTYVVAGNPSGSLLYQKINASPPCGARMPQGLAPLSDAQIATIGAWIMAGAKND
jgi:mono/diheme cytochrome c family protein